MTTIMELQLALFILIIICAVTSGMLLYYFGWERRELLQENMMYRRTIQAQNNIRTSCLAAYRAMLREANKKDR